MKPKSENIKQIDYFDCTQMKHSCTTKHIINTIKATGKWGRICQYINKELLSLVFEEVFFITKKMTNIQKKIKERL